MLKELHYISIASSYNCIASSNICIASAYISINLAYNYIASRYNCVASDHFSVASPYMWLKTLRSAIIVFKLNALQMLTYKNKHHSIAKVMLAVGVIAYCTDYKSALARDG